MGAPRRPVVPRRPAMAVEMNHSRYVPPLDSTLVGLILLRPFIRDFGPCLRYPLRCLSILLFVFPESTAKDDFFKFRYSLTTLRNKHTLFAYCGLPLLPATLFLTRSHSGLTNAVDESLHSDDGSPGGHSVPSDAADGAREEHQAPAHPDGQHRAPNEAWKG